MEMNEELKKAQVLVEALPYIQKFNRKIIVVKYGGSAMVDEELKRKVIQDVVLLKLVGFKPIIVHGGGKEISKWVEKSGMEPHFLNGLRVTDEPTMEIAEMVLNKVNKSLVSMIEELGVKACGISGKDGGMLKVDKKLSGGALWIYRCASCVPDMLRRWRNIIGYTSTRPAFCATVRSSPLCFPCCRILTSRCAGPVPC